jgi:hypothetical protein
MKNATIVLLATMTGSGTLEIVIGSEIVNVTMIEAVTGIQA